MTPEEMRPVFAVIGLCIVNVICIAVLESFVKEVFKPRLGHWSLTVIAALGAFHAVVGGGALLYLVYRALFDFGWGPR
jgi:hypothetical protein